jgi:hypothetical protein
VTTREAEESYRRGTGVPPHDETLDATLTADGDQTILVIEVRGMPLDAIAFYGVGWQIHAENLAAYLAGRPRGDTKARWDDLVPRLAGAGGQHQLAALRFGGRAADGNRTRTPSRPHTSRTFWSMAGHHNIAAATWSPRRDAALVLATLRIGPT